METHELEARLRIRAGHALDDSGKVENAGAQRHFRHQTDLHRFAQALNQLNAQTTTIGATFSPSTSEGSSWSTSTMRPRQSTR